MPSLRRVITLVLLLAPGPAWSQQACNSPEVLAELESILRERGSKDAEWLASMQLNVPFFRMKDVKIEILGTRTLAPHRNGVDCQVNVRMTTPPDVRYPNAVSARFNFVILSRGNGFRLDMY